MSESKPPILPKTPSAPTDEDNASDPLEQVLMLFFSLLGGAPFILTLLWAGGYWRQSEVISSSPIGHFIRMSGPGGFPGGVVIETDTGSYPLLKPPVISRGTALVLELRGNGQRFVCDLTRTLCIKTTLDEFKQSAQPLNSATP